MRGSLSGGAPPESLDAPADLPKEHRSQVALGQLQDVVSGLPNEAATGLEQALLQVLSKDQVGLIAAFDGQVREQGKFRQCWH